MKPSSSLLCLLQVLCTIYNLFVARASATLIKCPPCRYIVALIWGRRKFHTSLLRIRQIKSVLFSLIFANDKQILFWPTGSTPRVILGSETPQTPISTSGPGYIWWSIQFDRVVRIKRFSLAEHFTLIPLYTSIRLSSSVVVVIMYFLSSFCPQILLQSRVYPDRYLLFLLALLLTPTFLLLCSCFVFSVTRSSSSPCAYWPSLNIE